MKFAEKFPSAGAFEPTNLIQRADKGDFQFFVDDVLQWTDARELLNSLEISNVTVLGSNCVLIICEDIIYEWMPYWDAVGVVTRSKNYYFKPN